MKRVGQAILVLVSVIVVVFGGMVWSIARVHRQADRAAANIQLGMTVEQFVQNLPVDFDFGSIGESAPTQAEEACVSPGKSGAPTKSAANRTKAKRPTPDLDNDRNRAAADRIPFPAMRSDDPEAVRLANEANQSPEEFERFLALDRHLSSQNEYRAASDLWTYYVQDHPSEARAYCERGGAYQHQSDYVNAYKDVKKSCGLGDATCCQIEKTIPSYIAESANNEITQNDVPSVVTNACNTAAAEPARSFILSRRLKQDERIQVSALGGSAPSNSLSRAELLELLSKEYDGREWSVVFTYLTVTPQHISFRVTIGPDGKVKQKVAPHAWE